MRERVSDTHRDKLLMGCTVQMCHSTLSLIRTRTEGRKSNEWWEVGQRECKTETDAQQRLPLLASPHLLPTKLAKDTNSDDFLVSSSHIILTLRQALQSLL